MNPIKFKEIQGLIISYGSAQFWRGANNDNDEAFKRLTVDSEKYLKHIFEFLESEV